MPQAAWISQVMSNALKNLSALLYGGFRPLRQPSELPHPLKGRDLRFFAYGRHALVEAFVLAGVGKDDVVLLPEYICGETLSAVNACGARVEYYPVSMNMELAVSPADLLQASAILAVNYFGFAQDLTQFESYCDRTGAILIEDNAHGFLSQDEDGKYLGTRGDLGIFSFRKSMPLVNGSGVVVNHPGKVLPLKEQLPFRYYKRSRTFKVKRFLKHLPRWNLTGLLYTLISLERSIRTFRTDIDYVRSGVEEEFMLPGNPEPDASLLQVLKSLDVDCEISRRRRLYLVLQELVSDCGGNPIFSLLPAHVVPYGFPFRAPPERIEEIRRALKKYRFDSYLWPKLPLEIQQKSVERYNSVWMINFIW
jgi:hypothetical protein